MPDIYLLEARIEENFVKYGNNTGHINIGVNAELAHAFSHWCYEASAGRLMVTDLQGANTGTAFELTDPAIHCPVDLRRFGGTNLGRDGIMAFFRTHTCGATCSALSLTPAKPASGSMEDAESSLVSYLDSLAIYD